MISSFNKFKPQHNFFQILTAGPFVHMQKNFQIWFGFSKEFLYVKKICIVVDIAQSKMFFENFHRFFKQIEKSISLEFWNWFFSTTSHIIHWLIGENIVK